MEFRLLGLLEVVDNGRAVSIAHGKESALLALLLLHANEPVSADRLIHELWGERAPENAGKNVQQYVSRLRRHLGADRLATTPGGYLLRVEPEELDLDRFDHLAAAGRSALSAGDAPSAEELLSSALSLWRGPALADFRYDDFAQDAIRRLDGERRSVRSDRVEARLALGLESGVLPELQELIDEEPHWERPRGQLMLALYRAGRQADALDHYRATRDLFDSELGLEPSRELQELEHAILNHDPALSARAARPLRVRRRRGPVVYLFAGVGLLVAAAVAAAVVVLTGGSATALDNAVAVVGASGGSISYTSAGTTPGNVVFGDGGVWVLNADDRTITRIDPKTRQVVKTFATSGEPTDLAVGDGALWIGSSEPSHDLIESSSETTAVSRVDPTSTTLEGSADLPGAASPVELLGDLRRERDRRRHASRLGRRPRWLDLEDRPSHRLVGRACRRGPRNSRRSRRRRGLVPHHHLDRLGRSRPHRSADEQRRRSDSASRRRIWSGLRSGRAPSGRRTRSAG